MSLELLGFLITVIAIGGVMLNNNRRRECFLLWMVSNTLSIIVHLTATDPLIWMSIRDAAFLILAFQGYRKWGRSH